MTELEQALKTDLLDTLALLKNDLALMEARLLNNRSYNTILGVSKNAIQADLLLAQLKILEQMKG